MTAALLLVPAAPAPVASERVSCERCFEEFPERETEYHEPSERVLCLDCVNAVRLCRDDDHDATYRLYR